MSKEINKRIAMYRKLLNLSQAKTAELMDMKSSAYSQMEREGTITCDRLLKLAKIFDISPYYLLCGETKNKLKEETIFDPTPIEKPLVLSKNEENHIKILRLLSKEDRNEVLALLQEKYRKMK